MKISREAFNFNKELLFGELGSLIGIQLVVFLSWLFHFNRSIIPHLVVAGALVSGTLCWLLARIYDKSRKEKYSGKSFFNDMKYFVPASVFLTYAFYYPSLYFISKYFIAHYRFLESAAVFSEIIAFSLFMLGINLYRYILIKKFKKTL
ncbi:Uncharacterised protein [uncultured archaeon]|nr:Uncharacterised protein [uncultured archaeon]